MQRLLHILILLLSFWGNGNVFAQETEAQLKEKANKLFEKQDYVIATPAYLQLLALQPRSPEYNYKYGTCLLFNSRKKQDAIRYLEFATASGTVDLDAFYYMGKAYHLNYQFEEAIKFYNLYKTNSRGKPNKALEVERQIEMCGNGQRLLKNLTDIIVLEKKEYASGKFYELYDLKGFGGDILISTAEQSKLDKKKGHIPIIHFPPNAQRVFFASYGESETNGKQIYVKQKLKEGGWSVPEPVRGEVNTLYNEDFPYMDPGGEYLYFSSEGHNSMGGFDVFRSKYDDATNSFGLPENVDFAISSADDDLFYIVDSLGQNAWFASSRQSQDGKIYVYKVRVERLASPIAAIKGTFSSTVHPDNKKFNIEVKDLVSGRQIGTFYSDKDGSYLISLPKGGKYEYSIRITGSAQVFKAVVNVPVLNEFKPLKQQITHDEEASKEVVKVIDLFDQNVENAASVLAEIVQMRSELNPNAAQFDLQKLENPAGSKEIFAELGFQKLSPLEVKDKVQDLFRVQAAQAKILEEQQQKAIAQVIENTAEIKTLQAAFKTKVNETNETADPAEKYALYLEAEKKSAEITALEQENQKLLKYADSLAPSIQAENSEAANAKKTNELIAQVSDDGQIVKVISANKAQIKSLQGEKSMLPAEAMTQEILRLKREMDKLSTSRNSYQSTVKNLGKDIGSLENKLNEAKAKDKPAIQASIDAKKNEVQLMEQEIHSLDQQIEKLAVQLNKKEDQLEYFQNLEKKTLPAKSATTAEAQKAVQAADNQNYKTLKSYVAQQKAALEKNPAIANQGTVPEHNGPQETEAVIKRISPEHEAKLFRIENDSKLTEEERLQLAQQEDEGLKAKVDQEIERVEKTVKQNPSDQKAQAELKSLQAVQETVTNRMSERTDALSSLTETQPAKAVSAESIIKEIKPDLDKRLDEIANNPNLSVIEQLKMAQNEELEFEKILRDEIAVLENKIESNPSDQGAQPQLKTLQTLKKEVTERIDNRSLAITSLDPENHVAVEKPTKSAVLANLKPGYETKLAEIDSNPGLSGKEKLEQFQKEDLSLQSAVNAEIQQIEAALKKNPNDAESQAKYELLLEIRQEADQRIAERKEALEQPEIVQVPENTLPPATDIVAKVKPDHQQKITEIENDDLLSPLEKQTMLVEEESRLQKAIDAEIKATDKLLAKTPADEKLLAEKEKLLVSREQSENRADESRQFLVAEAKVLIKPADLLFRTDNNYQLDIQKIENSDGPDETERLIEREKASQQILQAQIEKNNQQLLKKDNPSLSAQNQVLNELIDASQKRVETLGGTKPENHTELSNSEIIARVRGANLGNNLTAMTDELNEPAALKNQAEALRSYQKDLEVLLDDNEEALSKNPADEKLLAEKNIYLEEQKAAAEKLETVNSKLKNLEKTVVSVQKDPENPVIPEQIPSAFSDNPDLRALQKEKAELDQKLADPALSAQEKEAVSKAISANETKQAKVENILLEEKIKDESASVPAELKAIENNVSTNEAAKAKELAAIESVRQSEAGIAVQLKEAKAEKDPAVKQELLNQVAKQQAENEAKLSEVQVDQALNKSVQKLQESDPGITLYALESAKDLENRRRRATIEIGELTSEMEQLDEEIKSSGRAKAKVLTAEQEAKSNELKTLRSELENVENELKKRNAKPLFVYNESAINENVSYEEERALASSENYKQYTRIAEESGALKRSIAEKEVKLEELKEENHVLILKDIDQQTNSGQGKVEENLVKISALTKEIDVQKSQNSEKKTEADRIINESGEAMKIQNLIARGVEPISKLAVVVTLIPLPSNGFEIVSNPKTAPVKNEIPVGVDVPSGLVYRVQVGAFAKPVKEELFKEFNPVSGEKMASGITRYMAGYFNNRAAVMNAREQIQGLGYSDAFPVAYCDGERISMQEARRLEASGACVPQGVENLMTQVSEHIAQVVPADTSARKALPAVSNPGAYNQAPGAAKAIAVETRPGLFYTVQVGVYNKPVPATQIKNMEPLITKRLANGQIRYSAGIFQSVESAQQKRQEAIARGIRDAYITAYYKGERISLEEARKLLAELGTGILEKENAKENKLIPQEKIRQIEAETQKNDVKTEQEERIENNFSEDQVQFISREAYPEFPADVLRRFNENGSFFYDINDQKVKSIVYKNEDYVPQVYYFRKEIDTVFLPKSDSLHKAGSYEIAAKFPATELSGEIGNWLLRLGYQREIKKIEDKVQVRIFGIKDEATFDEVLIKMKALGFAVLMAGGG